ncbi:unnamed protein product [Discosporangium mesarthrocarpum]
MVIMQILFINGNIWQWGTGREPASSANWLLISREDRDRVGTSGIILAVGSGDPPPEFRTGSQVMDLKGALVLPGLQDAHIHIGIMGESASYVDLTSCTSVAQVQDMVQAHALANLELPWVRARTADDAAVSAPAPPTRHSLDAAMPDSRPCLLYRRCWHALVANTAAIQAAGLDPQGGEGLGLGLGSETGAEKSEGENVEAAGGDSGCVEKDKDGQLTGLFLEDAMGLVEGAVKASPFKTRCKQFEEALDLCVESGLTAVHTNDHDAFLIYKSLQESGKIPLRVYVTPPHEEAHHWFSNDLGGVEGTQGQLAGHFNEPQTLSDGGNELTLEGRGLGKILGNRGQGLVRWHRVKLFADGSLGAETAAMRSPYVDTTNRGVLMHSHESLTDKVRLAREEGSRVEVHAIGDRALSCTLDAFEDAGLQAMDHPIVTHCQVAGPDLVARMKRLGAIAAIQPSFVASDAPAVRSRLSPEIHKHCYPWKSLLQAGVVCAGSSDAPVETQNPLKGMYDAVFRPDHHLANFAGGTAGGAVGPAEGGRDAVQQQRELPPQHPFDEDRKEGEGGEGTDTKPLVPKEEEVFGLEERLSIGEAVWLYTRGAAAAAGEEGRLGSLEEGYLADMTVIDDARILEEPG